MAKIHSGTHAPVNHNLHQQPKPVKENKTLKVEIKVEKENKSSKPHQTNAPSKKNINPSEAAAVKNGVDGSRLKSQLEAKLQAFMASKQKTASKPKPIEVKATYIPHNKRHKGLSKYDNLPHFVNRSGYYPDRYRAVNPKHEAAGVIGEAALKFPLKAGEHELVDGKGNRRGVIDATEVKLNYAQTKKIKGEDYYYAFSTLLDHDRNPETKSISASGWIKASAIESGNEPKYTQKDIEKSQPPPVSEIYGKYTDYQEYVVKNVPPEQLTGADGKPKYGYMENGVFVSYKVLPGKTKDENFAAGDYLRRDGNVINLGFNAAGMSNDTFKTDEAKPVVFHRAPGSVKDTTVDIDLYPPKEGNNLGETPVTRMRFVYGYVETQGTKRANGTIPIIKRWGWMALGALEPKK